jgi:hypothetical protein
MCVQTTIDLKGRLLKATLFCSLRHEQPGMRGKKAGFSAVFTQTICMLSPETPQPAQIAACISGDAEDCSHF